MPSELLFASYVPKTLEPKNSIGSKWLRLLDQLDLAAAVAGKRTAVKMHLGGGTGFSTISPFFVGTLVQKLKAAGAREVFVTDKGSEVRTAAARGYTSETVGCPIVPVSGTTESFFDTQPIEPPLLALEQVELAGEIVQAEALINLAHVKGHGDCAFGGASKNLSMGCVTGRTRAVLHSLEGGLEWDEVKCTACGTCVENCPNEAMKLDEQDKLVVFYHHCKFCQHCVLICPEDAITMEGGKYKDFQRGMALTTSRVLDTFEPQHVVHINFLMNITVFCDCWGMTTPALVPDIGILAGRDIVALEQASLDLIKTENLIPGAAPAHFKLGESGHLFERLHRKDPFVVVDHLAELGRGSKKYKLLEVE